MQETFHSQRHPVTPSKMLALPSANHSTRPQLAFRKFAALPPTAAAGFPTIHPSQTTQHLFPLTRRTSVFPNKPILRTSHQSGFTTFRPPISITLHNSPPLKPPHKPPTNAISFLEIVLHHLNFPLLSILRQSHSIVTRPLRHFRKRFP